MRPHPQTEATPQTEAIPLIGAHVSVAGGLATGGLRYAAAVGAEAIQLFVTNPRAWATPPGDPGQDEALRAAPLPIYVHASYLINLGSAEGAARSIPALAHALSRGAEIGARGVVVHTGSAIGTDRDTALGQVAKGLLPLLDKLGDDGPDLLLEPMAGQGQMLCADLGELAGYLDALRLAPAGVRVPGHLPRVRGRARPDRPGRSGRADQLRWATRRAGSGWCTPTTRRPAADPAWTGTPTSAPARSAPARWASWCGTRRWPPRRSSWRLRAARRPTPPTWPRSRPKGARP